MGGGRMEGQQGPSGEMGRRGFLKGAIGLLSAGIVGLLGWPLVASLVGTIYRLPKTRFVAVGPMAAFPKGRPVAPHFRTGAGDAVQSVWVIKHSPTEATVFSPICPHLGCYYDWYPQAGKFICPCHASVFSATGQVLGGPAPRPLDTLPCKIENGTLLVQWEQYEVGTPRKVRIG
jgi:menaquinol-cytochrome c reductase iron-sulfur subunit